jgi:hypothetical protein
VVYSSKNPYLSWLFWLEYRREDGVREPLGRFTRSNGEDSDESNPDPEADHTPRVKVISQKTAEVRGQMKAILQFLRDVPLLCKLIILDAGLLYRDLANLIFRKAAYTL